MTYVLLKTFPAERKKIVLYPQFQYTRVSDILHQRRCLLVLILIIFSLQSVKASQAILSSQGRCDVSLSLSEAFRTGLSSLIYGNCGLIDTEALQANPAKPTTCTCQPCVRSLTSHRVNEQGLWEGTSGFSSISEKV